MKNTLENKAKFFAQYWGQKVLCFNDEDQYKPCICYQVDGSVDDSSFLELKPLSHTTDEDAIKLFDFLYPRNTIQGYDSYKISRAKDCLKKFSTTEKSNFVDFIRGLGYAREFNRISVEQQIEFGWVKLKKE